MDCRVFGAGNWTLGDQSLQVPSAGTITVDGDDLSRSGDPKTGYPSGETSGYRDDFPTLAAHENAW